MSRKLLGTLLLFLIALIAEFAFNIPPVFYGVYLAGLFFLSFFEIFFLVFFGLWIIAWRPGISREYIFFSALIAFCYGIKKLFPWEYWINLSLLLALFLFIFFAISSISFSKDIFRIGEIFIANFISGIVSFYVLKIL